MEFGGYYSYDTGHFGNTATFNIGDFRVGMVSVDTYSQVLAYALLSVRMEGNWVTGKTH